jgi:AraC-like DNA-binding protein
VEDFRCRAHVEREGTEEPNPAHSIVFVRRGVFGRRHRGESLVADPNQILFFHAGEPYRYSHPVPGGDECTILTLEPATALDAAQRLRPQAEETPGKPFVVGHALGGRKSARLHYELLAALRRDRPQLAIEDVLSELIDEALRAAAGAGIAVTSEIGRAARRRREAVEEAKLLLNANVERPPRLGAMATALGCSPFHLSRIFRQTTGISLRGYLGRLRARLAAERLARGAPDLTELALDLGFADHSHFTNAFRREWGVPPSRLRERT